ncbi:MAG: TonB-dependent receptor [Bacteroidales bacterium]|nr:TonB-dependent receptor [Bacteroidales bacterium]
MRRTLIFNSTVFFLLFFAVSLTAQFSISGKITDAANGEPLAGANVTLDDGNQITASNAKGLYSFTKVSGGDHKLTVSFIGFKTIEKSFQLTASKKVNISMSASAVMSDEVIVTATRAGDDSPTTYSMIDREEIERNNQGQDLPYLLQMTPSVVTTSDAGTGIGYTGIRLRGTDISRINVTMNGVPINDAESHGVYFVDLPDLASSVENIQIQRGVGTSTNGAAAFGGSINIKTTGLNPDPYASLSSAYGVIDVLEGSREVAGDKNTSAGFDDFTYKNTVRFGTGLINDHWAIDGRLSSINSDGYIDRGWSDLKSFYMSGGYYGDNTVMKAIVTSGKESTYQSWNGIPKDSLETNRKYNPSGEMYDDDGNITGYYKNETDNYQQDYYQFHLAHRFAKNLNLTSTLFYTHGEGYYESFRNDDAFTDYGYNDIFIGGDTISETDLVRQKWLNNDYYGLNLAVNYNYPNIKMTLGGGYNRFVGDHYGYIIWAENAGNSFITEPWYENTGKKSDYNIFLKTNYTVVKELNLYADLQIRSIRYDMEGLHDNLRNLTQSHDFFFFNPKGGAVLDLDKSSQLYASVAVAHREPPRGAYRDADPGQDVRSERLIDYEAGYRFQSEYLSAEANYYFMDYKDQLVKTGEINNVGDAILVNVPKSYRTGIELSAAIRVAKILRWDVTGTLSSNKIVDYVAYTDDWDNYSEQVPDTIGTTNISFSPDITASSSLSISPVENFSATLNSRYVGRQYIDNSSLRERSIDPYFVNDLRFDYTFKPGLFKNVGVFLSLMNIFNVEYETNAWVYPYYYGGDLYEMYGYFPQAKFNMMVGVNLEF